jgi:hypothetical protein
LSSRSNCPLLLCSVDAKSPEWLPQRRGRFRNIVSPKTLQRFAKLELEKKCGSRPIELHVKAQYGFM